MLMLLAETQQAGILGALILAVGMALLARLLYKPRDEQIVKDNKPNTATQRGAFIPLVFGTRRVGAVVGFVGNRYTTQEEIPGGGKGLGGDTPEQTIYWEDGIHYLCVGPANHIFGIYVDGKRIAGSTSLNSLTHPSGTAITFPGQGTMRIYWGTLNHPSGSLLESELGIASQGPYVVRIEWNAKRLGTMARWPIIEYVVQCDCPVEGVGLVQPTIGQGVNPAYVLWQLLTAAYPHGGGMPTAWIDFEGISEISAVAITESIGMNILVQNGEPLDRILGEIMADFGFLLPECSGVISPCVIREIPGDVPDLNNDLLIPPIESIEKIHASPLGDALIYEYEDKNHDYRTGTIDVDDDSIAAVRNQRKTKKIKLSTVTERNVASKIAARRQIEDLEDAVSVKAKGLRGLRAVTVGQAFDLPGVGRMRCLGYKLHWDSPTVELDLLRDPFNQEIIEFTDPGLPGGIPEGNLEPDIRYDAFELPYLVLPGINSLVVFRHRDNQSIFQNHIWTSPDDITYTPVGNQDIACAGGVLESEWDESHHMPIIENGPLITIDGNGDETTPRNLSSVPNTWIAGAQLMVIGDGPDAELFYVREWQEVVADTTWQPRGLVRARMNQGLRSPPLKNAKGRYRAHAAGSPCYIIAQSHLQIFTGGDIQFGAIAHVKAQPENQQGALPIAAVLPDDITQQSLGTRTPPLAWFTCGGDYSAPAGQGRRDLSYSPEFCEKAGTGEFTLEEIVFEFLPAASSGGAGMQGMGQPTEIAVATGNLIVEVYMAEAGDELLLINTHTIAIAPLLDATTGIYAWTYTRALANADVDAAFEGLDLQSAAVHSEDDGIHNFVWKFLLYHHSGTLSPPVELRPYALDQILPHNWIPGTQQ